MRIQHNIMSMNAYRNYNNNASALGKNLEKLSSGYKINRAGDDAAGLAISEKMRAQIKGLDAATKNVKDGISLVKTAEGAMQEIQDMLSRMKYLATQSANGTYDDDVDRKALQNEVEQLNSEINRIADSANFNGTKLLDGSLAGTSEASDMKVTLSGSAITASGGATFAGTLALNAAIASSKAYELSFTYLDEAGNKQVATIKAGGSTATSAGIVSDVVAQLQKLVGDKFTVEASTDKKTFTFTAASKGVTEFRPIKATLKIDGATTTAPTAAVTTEGKDDVFSIALAGKNASSGETIQINDDVYEIVQRGKEPTTSNAKALYVDANAMSSDGVAAIVEQLKSYGVNATVNETTKTTIDIAMGSSASGGLKLQIGDTGDNYNQLSVVVKDLHATAIGCAGVDISSIDGAKAAIDTVKDCINYVSEIRGTLGATQNRLEHTQNNLSVMKENIQDAESTIRDTDVADEMMAYTKNNILIQSAQAMLAQANAVPQGVLQLLQ